MMSYRLGHWLGQPFLLTEVSLEDHPLSSFAFHDRLLVLPFRGVAEAVLVHRLLDQVAAEAAAELAAEAALFRVVVQESPQAHLV